MSLDTVGALLAGTATSLNDGLRILMFADKRQWGPDEFEQVRALEEALDEAKRDFQTLSPLVNGQYYYENDRRGESLEELRAIKDKFESHTQNFKDWLRQGGPINPTWALETVELKRELHRAQCRAACRIFATSPGPDRCLGAFQVRRRHRELQTKTPTRGEATVAIDESERMLGGDGGGGNAGNGGVDLERGDAGGIGVGGGRDGVFSGPESPEEDTDAGIGAQRRMSLEAVVPDCNAIGRFERFGDRDVAFVCDYCDGFLVWEDVRSMPSSRKTPAAAVVAARHSLNSTANRSSRQTPLPTAESTPASAAAAATAAKATAAALSNLPNWKASATAISTSEEKDIVFAPLAIANHLLPVNGDWRARIMCPFCDEYTYYEGDNEMEMTYAQDERGFPDVSTFQEHLEWYHAGMVPMPSMPTKKTNCIVM